MSLFLKQFSTHSEYDAYINGSDAILPNVSICTTEEHVHYNPYVPPIIDGHDYVEIGGLKWATMNIGANSPTDAGLYFQWGDTQGYTADQVGSGKGKKYFGWGDYKFSPSDDSETFTKYNSTDGKTVLDAEDDAAQAAWGGSWRMPTYAEFIALGEAVNTAWTSSYNDSGVAGLVCTDKADSSKVLFFPAAGYCGRGRVYIAGSGGYYFSSSVNTSIMDRARGLEIDSRYTNWQHDTFNRYYGATVRGVVN